MRVLGSVVVLAVVFSAPLAWAQTPAPAPAATPAPAPAATPAPAPAAAPAPAPAPAAAPAPAPPAAPGAAPYPYSQPPPAYGYAPAPQQSPPELPYEDGAPIPAGYRLEERPLKGLVIGGALTLGIPYVVGLALVASAHFPNESQWLAAPVLGPWIAMGARRTTCDISHDADFCGLADFGANMIYIMDGIVQVAGATMLIVGVTVTRRHLVRSDLVSLDVTPMRVGSGYGLGAIGNF